MGTSAACMWATTYFCVHECRKLIPTYKNQLSLLRRFIDDMIGIWVGSASEWQSFKNDTNNFGILTWEFEEPSTSVVFLDLTISIKSGRIVYKTFQKALNLYQYIPPTSAHPPWMMRGIINSLMRNYRHQNISTEDQALQPPCCKRLGLSHHARLHSRCRSQAQPPSTNYAAYR